MGIFPAGSFVNYDEKTEYICRLLFLRLCIR